jgi:DNA-binding CsgD family transcriptional regulator
MIAARVHHAGKDNASAERTARPVLAEATASGDRWAITGSANIVAAVLADRGDLLGSLKYFDRGLAATEGQPTLADQRRLLLRNRAELTMYLDRSEEARSGFLQARALAQRTGNIRRLKSIQAGLCALYFGIGQWDDAIIEAELREDVEDVMFRLEADGVAAQIALHRQDKRTARQRLASARALFEQNGHPRGPRAAALEREVAGDPAGALAILSAALGATAGRIETETWLPDIVGLATELGEQETAVAAARRAEELISAGQVPRRLAAAVHCRGLLDADPAALLRAADAYEQIGRPLPQAQALEAAAGLWADAGDTTSARPPFVAAMGLYTELGADWDITRMRARFRPHGLRQPTRRRRRPTTGWEALTRAEAKVVELVAEGISNPEIAEQLMLTRRTVETHVAHALAKLQARSRVDLARATIQRATPSGR